jgi:hypothetical protein
LSGPVKVPPAGAFAELVTSPTQLLDVTMDQLRTLLAVREAGSPLRAARLLDREHSSVRKQVDTLNRLFQQVCGEALVVKQGRGQDYLFTPTGETVADIAARSFADWLAGITDRRRKLGATVSVATTEFTVDFLAQVWPDVAEEFTRREIQLESRMYVPGTFGPNWTPRTSTSCAAVWPRPPATTPTLAHYDVIEWHREDLALVTNLSTGNSP